MNFQGALKDFKRVNEELKGINPDNNFMYSDGDIRLKMDVVSMLIERHYPKEITTQRSIWGSNLTNIPKTTVNNEIRLSKIISLVEEIIKDIQSRMEQAGETDNSSILDDQLNAVNKELANADIKKANLQREIRDFEADLKKERSQLGMYSETVENQERQRRNEINDKIKQRQNDLILLQQEVNGLKVDKGRIEEQIRANKKKPNPIDNAEITIIDEFGESLPFNQIGRDLKRLKEDSANAKNEIAELKGINTTVVNENESITKENNELKLEVATLKNQSNNSQPKFLVALKCSIFALLSYIIVSSYYTFNIAFNVGIYVTTQLLLVLILAYSLNKQSSEKSTFWLNFIAGVFLVALGVVLTKYL